MHAPARKLPLLHHHNSPFASSATPPPVPPPALASTATSDVAVPMPTLKLGTAWTAPAELHSSHTARLCAAATNDSIRPHATGVAMYSTAQQSQLSCSLSTAPPPLPSHRQADSQRLLKRASPPPRDGRSGSPADVPKQHRSPRGPPHVPSPETAAAGTLGGSASAASASVAAPSSSLYYLSHSSSQYLQQQRQEPSAQPWNNLLRSSPAATVRSNGVDTDADRGTATMGTRSPEPQQRSRQEALEDIDHRLTVSAARHLPDSQRNAAVRRALEDVGRVYPPAATVLMQASRYIREVNTTLTGITEAHAADLAKQEAELYNKMEGFFEGKIYNILLEKKRTEAAAQQLHSESFELRRERDEDLMALKTQLMKRLNECEKKEDEISSFRKLIASVFKTNEQLTTRIGDLEALLAKHRIDIPTAPSELYTYAGKGGGGAARQHLGHNGGKGGEVRPLESQVSPAFIVASREEMDKARLTLQRELLHNAFDDRTAFRLQVNNLKTDNNNLTYKLSLAEENVAELNRYIYEKRFLTGGTSTEGDENTPLTPRPRDVPFSIQTELGIDLRRPTGDMVAELSAAATNLKHQLTSALLRLRQMATVSEWMQEETLIELDEDRGEVGLLPTFPVSMWPSIPHFLRTHVSPDVSNLRWPEETAAAIFLEFFEKFKELRANARFVRDEKMVAPRKYQLFERREQVLVRLDATKSDVERDEENVPIGYIVSQYISEYLLQLSSATVAANATLVLPGTLNPRYTVRGRKRPVELEFTRFAYNLWWAAHRYRQTQPICRLFLEVVNGKVPMAAYAQMERSLLFVKACVERLDADRSHTFTYSKLLSGTLRILHDVNAYATRGGLLAVAQTFEENQTPFFGGRVRLATLLADESYVAQEPAIGLEAARQQAPSLPPRITARYIPGRNVQPLGASVYMRFWRKLVLDQYARTYAAVESILAPLVVESEVVLGLYLIPVPRVLERIAYYDANFRDTSPAVDITDHVSLDDLGLIPGELAGSVTPTGATSAAAEGANSYTDLAEAVPSVTRNYKALLAERGAVSQAKRRARHLQLRTIVSELLARLPRLSKSVHFPFTMKQEDGAGDVDSFAPLNGTRTAVEANGEAAGRSALGSAAALSRTTPTTSSRSTTAKRAGAKPNTTAVPSSATATSAKKASKRKKKQQSEGEGGRGGSPRKTAHRNRQRSAEISAEIMMDADGQLVEWFGFCMELRQQAISFPERIFVCADDVSELHDLSVALAEEEKVDAVEPTDATNKPFEEVDQTPDGDQDVPPAEEENV